MSLGWNQQPQTQLHSLYGKRGHLDLILAIVREDRLLDENAKPSRWNPLPNEVFLSAWGGAMAKREKSKYQLDEQRGCPYGANHRRCN